MKNFSNFLPQLALLLFSVGAIAPTSNAQEAPTNKALVSGANKFALELYQKLGAHDANAVFSPYSISSALSMTSAGAKEGTLKEFVDVLHLPQSGTELYESLQSLSASLARAQSKDLTFRIANALWVQSGYPLTETFSQVIKKYFAGEFKDTDFKKHFEEARKQINSWVEKQTEEKIKNLLVPGTVNADTRLVLVNAIYFLGSWLHPFKAEGTWEGDFHVSPNKNVTAKFMNLSERFNYTENDELQMIELPYQGGRLVMDLVLPRKIENVDSLAKLLTTEKIASFISGMKGEKVSLKLPKYKIESAFSLKDKLQQLGMRDAFVFGPADFSGMNGNRELFIGDVIHKAFIEVDEKGTEAAAATAVVMLAGSAFNPEKPKEFHADRPFLFFIRDRETGAIVFFGHVANPA